MNSKEVTLVKIQFKNISLIHISFICFILALFVNCSGKDTPFQKSPSQIEEDNKTDETDTDSDETDEEDDNDSDNNDDSNSGNDNDNDSNNNDDDDDDNDYNFSERSESPPNLKHVIDQIAQQCPEQMQALSDGQEWTGNLDFLDLVVAALRKEDKRWGYSFWDGHIWSSDMIGYYRGTGDPNGSNDIVILDYFIGKSGDQRTDWLITTYEKTKEDWPNSEGEWRYPRPGATVSLSDCSGAPKGDNDVSDFSWDKVTWLRDQNVSGWEESSEITSVEVKSNGQICIDHTEFGQWPSGTPFPDSDDEFEGNAWVIVKLNGQYYASTYEWLRANNPSQRCKLGEEGNISETYHELGRDQIRIAPLDASWIPQGGDVIGFMVSGLARHQHTIPNVRKRTNIQWYRLPSVDGSISGQMLGTYSSKNDN